MTKFRTIHLYINVRQQQREKRENVLYTEIFKTSLVQQVNSNKRDFPRVYQQIEENASGFEDRKQHCKD